MDYTNDAEAFFLHDPDWMNEEPEPEDPADFCDVCGHRLRGDLCDNCGCPTWEADDERPYCAGVDL